MADSKGLMSSTGSGQAPGGSGGQNNRCPKCGRIHKPKHQLREVRKEQKTTERERRSKMRELVVLREKLNAIRLIMLDIREAEYPTWTRSEIRSIMTHNPVYRQCSELVQNLDSLIASLKDEGYGCVSKKEQDDD